MLNRSKLYCILALFAAVILGLPALAHAKQTALPRTIFVVYDSGLEPDLRYSKAHHYIELPLNHLGFYVQYVDVREPLPEYTDDVYGIVIWIGGESGIDNPKEYLGWLSRGLDKGKKLVALEGLGINYSYMRTPQGMSQVNDVLRRIGVELTDQGQTITYHTSVVYKNPAMMEFERSFNGVFPPYALVRKIGKDTRSHFSIQQGGDPDFISHQVITSPNGGYVVDGYVMYYNDAFTTQKWYINPFLFLSLALNADPLPKPDTTTLSGRRIFFSHIDGDGWNNISEIEKYKSTATSAEVLLKDVFEAYPDLPFNMGFVAGDLDPNCYGMKGSLDVARAMLRLKNVEASSHTYTHPLYWGFFVEDSVEREKKYLPLYPPKPGTRSTLFTSIMHSHSNSDAPAGAVADPTLKVAEKKQKVDIRTGVAGEEKELMEYYKVPRSYACYPYSEKMEVEGSIDFINSLVPEGRPKVKLYQWSGNTNPYEKILAQTRNAGLFNINGGDTRFDKEYDSYSWVSPIGLKVGDEIQIYAAGSNENTYTFLWTKRFYGYRYLRATMENTEHPLRVKPANVYFHTYSAEKAASLNAVKENLDFVRTRDINPIMASHYTSIANSFYKVKFHPLGPDRWKITDHGDLATIRFDNATLKQVDFARSVGVIGQRYYQGSMYVSIDSKIKEPVVALKANPAFGTYPENSVPYMVDSSWDITEYSSSNKGLIFTANGYGPFKAQFKLPKNNNKFIVEIKSNKKSLYKKQKNVTKDGLLLMHINVSANNPIRVSIRPL